MKVFRCVAYAHGMFPNLYFAHSYNKKLSSLLKALIYNSNSLRSNSYPFYASQLHYLSFLKFIDGIIFCCVGRIRTRDTKFLEKREHRHRRGHNKNKYINESYLFYTSGNIVICTYVEA